MTHLFSSKVLSVLTTGLIVVGAIIVWLAMTPAQSIISWTPTSVNQTVLSGESITIPVSFSASEDIDDGVDVRIVPELEPYIQTNPTSFPHLTAGENNTIDVTITVPADATPAVFEWTIQLRTVGRPPRNFARPLPVVVEVVWQSFSDDQLGFTIEYPPTWVIRPGGRTTIFSNVLEPSDLSDTALQTESFFGIQQHTNANPNMLPIAEWFNQFSAGGFSVSPLSRTLVLVGGRDAIRIETVEIGGKRVHLYVATQTDITEIIYGLFAEQFVDEYEIMLNSLRYFDTANVR